MQQKTRILSVDILRGIVMIIMALDHTRDYFTDVDFNPTDLDKTTPALFFTRWITHFCAPVFVLLSGTSVFLTMKHGKSKMQASVQLLLRGFWLLVLEMTIVRLGWTFNLDYSQLFVQVIWAIGWSMMVLAGLIHLPKALIGSFCGLLIVGHNLADSIEPAQSGIGMFWNFLHEPGNVAWMGDNRVYVLYPLVPWIAVMPMGYLFGQLLTLPQQARDRWFYAIGFGAMTVFVLLRVINLYGDPEPRTDQWLSFFNTSKYPPSLQYLLMTLGPAIALMPLLEKMTNGAGRVIAVYGRVPLFYYILHIYLIHGLERLGRWALHAPVNPAEGVFGPGENWGFGLPVVYAVWILVIVLLYAPCRWMMHLKSRNKSWWTSYI